jgi:hypothetical protein
MVLQKVLNKFGNVKNYPYLCIIMKREITTTVILFLFFASALYVVLITSNVPTASSLEKVRIDSVYSKPRHEVMPELMWVYTTKQGSFTTNDIQKYKIGDSIEIKMIKIIP